MTNCSAILSGSFCGLRGFWMCRRSTSELWECIGVFVMEVETALGVVSGRILSEGKVGRERQDFSAFYICEPVRMSFEHRTPRSNDMEAEAGLAWC